MLSPALHHAIRGILKINLSDTVTEQAISAVYREHDSGHFFDEEDHGSYPTVDLFDWHSTPEGGHFWSTIEEKISKIR